MGSLFEKMIEEFCRQDGAHMLDTYMRGSRSGQLGHIPRRYQIIAMGFARRLTLEQVRSSLAAAGCEQLYARNFWEAGLIYAFANRMSYEQWKSLQQYCSNSPEFELTSGNYFKGNNITFAELKSYVQNGSVSKANQMHTQQLTRYLERQIQNLPDDREQFRRFLLGNINSFSNVREKSRYYFCKYLYYYIRQKMNNYQEARMTGRGIEEALSDLLVLKGISSFRRKQIHPQAAQMQMEQCAISCGNIYDAFNYFYFDYVSSDWMEVLLDYYGDIRRVPVGERHKLARALQAYNPKWRKLPDQDVLNAKLYEIQQKESELDQAYSLSGGSRGYQKNRSGEKSVRNYIKGVLDIDRTTLICYLIFFGAELHISSTQMITMHRLNYILRECGFPILRPDDEFDDFIIRYLHAADPVDFLMESVTSYAFQNKNFFLYHMYNASVSNEEQLERVFFSRKR